MYLCDEFVFFCLILSAAHAGGPGGIFGFNNIIGIPGFGSKGNTSGDGSAFSSIIPGYAQNIFGLNKTSSGNDTNSGSGSDNGGNFGSIISGIPNKIFPNKTGQTGDNSGIPGFGYISGIPNKIFGNNGTGSNTGNGLTNFAGVASPEQIFGDNKTDSANGTDSNNGFSDWISVIPGIFGNKNKTNSKSGNGTIDGSDSSSHSENGTNTSGFPDFSSYIPGLSNNRNKTNILDHIPSFPHIFGNNSSDSKNETSDSSNPLTGFNYGSITSIPNKIFGNHKENTTRHKRKCSHHSSESSDSSEEHEHDETSRSKRQIGSGLGSIGSLIPGGSNLSSLGSNLAGDSGDATLVLGMFQVLVKPIKTPSIQGMTDIIKNPQNLITQPQTLLNGGKS